MKGGVKLADFVPIMEMGATIVKSSSPKKGALLHSDLKYYYTVLHSITHGLKKFFEW